MNVKKRLSVKVTEIKNRYGDKRMSTINLHEDLSIERRPNSVEDVIITTNGGYIKRMKVDQYKAQNRGGVVCQELKFTKMTSLNTLV